MHISRQSIEFRHDDRRPLAVAASGGEGGDKLRPALQRVRTFAAFRLGELGGDLEAFGGGEPDNGGALRFEAQAAAALFLGADAVVADDRLGHDDANFLCNASYVHFKTLQSNLWPRRGRFNPSGAMRAGALLRTAAQGSKRLRER